MLTNKWYLICPSKDLKNEIRSEKILGEDIIIYRTKSGEATALEDRCCHRNVKLSLGYLEGENVVCGYHGWEYNCEGSCVLNSLSIAGHKNPTKSCNKKISN